MRSLPFATRPCLWTDVLRTDVWSGLLGLAVAVSASAALGEEAKSTQNDLNVTASAWPEADAMFHRDPRWLGGDDAYSVDLGRGRVAWFFGDSFVAPTTPGQRRGTTMVRNSVGLQTGYDPTTSKFKAYWREEDGKPKSFIADEGKEFLWPGGSLLVDGKLLMFMMRARDANRKLAFDVTGWGAVLIENLDVSPDQWKVRKLTAPQNPFGVLVGSASLVRDGDHLVAFSVSSEAHDVHLVRWRLSDAFEGDLTKPQWWAGSKVDWVDQEKLTELPSPVFKGGQTEFTVHFSRPLKCYIQIQFAGFPLSPIGFRTARVLTGPWSELDNFYEPKKIKSDDPEQMLYAAKAHPEQTTDGLAMTYCSNTFQLESLFENLELYFPRFLQLKLTPAAKND